MRGQRRSAPVAGHQYPGGRCMVLVTGSNSLLGTRLVQKLTDAGEKVRCLDLEKPASLARRGRVRRRRHPRRHGPRESVQGRGCRLPPHGREKPQAFRQALHATDQREWHPVAPEGGERRGREADDLRLDLRGVRDRQEPARGRKRHQGAQAHNPLRKGQVCRGEDLQGIHQRQQDGDHDIQTGPR